MHGISIIIHAHNAAASLERSLPAVLGQDYPRFEVLVVVDNCTDLTVERLEQVEMRWPQLRHIAIPPSAWHHDRHRLATALGARTAQYDWIMLLHPDFAPHSTLWLGLMASAAGATTQRVLGYTGIEDDGTHDGMRFVTTFEQWLGMARLLPGVEDSNTLVRRELLLEESSADGVNAILLHPDASVHRTVPYGGMWWHEQLRRHRRHTSRQPSTYRLLHAIAVWQAWIAVAASILTGLLLPWWAALLPLTVWLVSSTWMMVAFCRRTGERPFFLTHLPRTLYLPFILGY